ncbi:MAG: wax ester/triacylglycerol synthase family O-acyltransferase [Burkholderiaceae bacterium]|nr:wax ester/triacylglycerol synthase family O-acyltransferase [Burkholderiaceae bacterium]
MRQLNPHDASLLAADTRQANGNVTLIHIYDPSTAPGGEVRFKSILAHIQARLHRSPVFRQKLVPVPFGLDAPYWVEDEHFDLEYHVRHIGLPRPGDWRQFCIQASRIHARPLDMNRPLWEIHVIEGLDGLLELPRGSFALLTKIHHAAIDIESGNEITMLLHDLSARAPRPEPALPWFPKPAPGGLGLLRRSAVKAVFSPWQAALPLTRALVHAAPAAFSLALEAFRHPRPIPATRFNSVISPHRVFETRRFGIDEFERITALVEGASVDDAIAAVCAGGLRAYLQGKGELPPASLWAVVPFRLDDGTQGERSAGEPAVSWLRIELGTHLDDPVQRLAFVHAQTSSSGAVAQALSARELTEIERHAPAATMALASKALAGVAQGKGRHTPLANCTITRVTGPSVPLYLGGARMTYFSAILPISDGMGLVFAVTRYEGRIVISPTSCRELMPDPAQFAQCVRDSFQALLALAPQPPARPDAKRARAGSAPASGLRAAAPRGSASGKASPARPAARTAATALRPGTAARRRARAPSD